MSFAKSSQRPRLALLSASYDDEFQTRVLHAAERAAREHQMDFVAVSGGVLGLDSKRFAYDLVNERNVDAVVIATHTTGYHSTLTEIRQFVDKFSGMPRVSLGVELEGVPTLLIDNEVGMNTAVAHLIGVHGLRRIAFVTGPADSQEAEARYMGYCRALEEHDIPVDQSYVVHGEFSHESGCRAVQVLFEQRGFSTREVEAIVCADDITALGVLDELDRRGIRVPRDMALVGFDDIEFARYAKVPLTTVRQPIPEQLRYAVQILVNALGGSPTEAGTTTFKTEFVKRRSCGCQLRRQEMFSSSTALGKRMAFEPAMRARWSTILDELHAAAFDVADVLPVTWDERLINAFLEQLTDYGSKAFFETFEDVCYALMRANADVGLALEALVVLRRHAMRCAGELEDRARIESLLQDALLIASDMVAISQSQRREQLLYRMLELGQVNAALLAAPDLTTLSDTAARHLPRLGIRSGVIALFTEPNRITEELEAPLVFNEHGRNSFRMRYPTRDLAPDSFLSGRSVVVEPLAFRNERLGVALFEYGAADIVLYEELRQVLSAAVKGALLIHALKEAQKEVEKRAITDPLTSLSNRRHLTQRLREEHARARRYRRLLSAVILDLDGFKQVNDRYGHEAGDRTLENIAVRLKEAARLTDTVARYGGDEFVLLLPETNANEAIAVSERICASVAAEPVDEYGIVTVSAGVATFDPRRDRWDDKELLRRADGALLEAKRSGKARVMHSEQLANRSDQSGT